MYLVINKCVTAVKVSNFSGHYLRNRSNLDIGVLGYIGIVQHKEHPPEVFHIPPGTPCISSLGLLSEAATYTRYKIPGIQSVSGFLTRDPSNHVPSDLRLRPHGHRNRSGMNLRMHILNFFAVILTSADPGGSAV